MSLDDGPSCSKRPRLSGLKHVKAETVKEEEPKAPVEVIVESGPVEYVKEDHVKDQGKN